MKLIYIDTIRTLLRNVNTVDIVVVGNYKMFTLILAERQSLPIKNWEKNTDYYEQVGSQHLLRQHSNYFNPASLTFVSTKSNVLNVPGKIFWRM